MSLLTAVLIGMLFGTGIAISGMINPSKVLNFFDIAGNWDPSLAFVMGGALGVALIGYRLVLRRPGPVFDRQFHLPPRRDIDLPLIAGAVLFGIGWGIAGFCPGASIPALGLLQPDALIFATAMLAGIFLTRSLQNRRSHQGA